MPIIKAQKDSFYGEDSDKSEKSGSGTMLSKSVLGGKEIKPGDQIILRVTGVYDDEVGVEYAKGDEKAKEPAPAESEDETEAAPSEQAPEQASAPAEESFYAQ